MSKRGEIARKQYERDKENERRRLQIENAVLRATQKLTKENAALRKAGDEMADKMEDYAAATYPILNLDCNVTGTCKDCLEDGRGTHTEQADHALKQFDKARDRWQKVSTNEGS